MPALWEKREEADLGQTAAMGGIFSPLEQRKEELDRRPEVEDVQKSCLGPAADWALILLPDLGHPSPC